MPLKYLAFAGLLALLGAPNPANAHSFDVAIVAPATSGTLTDVLAGFRIATRERDGHPDEESDGHLGGLDVYMVPVDATADSNAIRAAARATDMALVIGADELRDVLAIEGILVIVPGVLPGEGNWLGDGEAISAPVTSFIERYTVEFGRKPSRAAAMGYNAARRIAAAVRPQGGVDDTRALARALAASSGGVEW